MSRLINHAEAATFLSSIRDPRVFKCVRLSLRQKKKGKASLGNTT